MSEAPMPAGAVTDTGPAPNRCNLGSGEDYREGWFNVDYNARYNPDAVVDLREEWPTAWHGTFDCILASHVFEHLPDLDHAFREAARCLRPDGRLKVRVPIGVNARTDRTHAHEWTYDTPLQFAQNWREYNGHYQFDPTVPFTLVGRDLDMEAHVPFDRLGPLYQWLADRRPGVWTSAAPFASGELTAVYRRCER